MTSSFVVSGAINDINAFAIRKAFREQCEEFGPSSQPIALTIKVFTKKQGGRTWDYYEPPHEIAHKVVRALEGSAFWSSKKVMRLMVEKYFSKRLYDHLYVELTKLRGVS